MTSKKKVKKKGSPNRRQPLKKKFGTRYAHNVGNAPSQSNSDADLLRWTLASRFSGPHRSVTFFAEGTSLGVQIKKHREGDE
jgi:hypothetical protein